MAWCRPGDKPLSEPMMVSLLRHLCVTRYHWVNIPYHYVNMITYPCPNWAQGMHIHRWIPTLDDKYANSLSSHIFMIIQMFMSCLFKKVMPVESYMFYPHRYVMTRLPLQSVLLGATIEVWEWMVLVTPCLLIRGFIHMQHRNIMHGWKPNVVLWC